MSTVYDDVVPDIFETLQNLRIVKHIDHIGGK